MPVADDWITLASGLAAVLVTASTFLYGKAIKKGQQQKALLSALEDPAYPAAKGWRRHGKSWVKKATKRHADGAWATEIQLSPGKATPEEFGKAIEAICAGKPTTYSHSEIWPDEPHVDEEYEAEPWMEKIVAKNKAEGATAPLARTCRVCKFSFAYVGAQFCPKCGYTAGPRKTMKKALLDLRDRMNRAGLPLADRKAYLPLSSLIELDREFGWESTFLYDMNNPGKAFGFQLILSEEIPAGEIVAFIPDDERTFRS